MPNFMSVSLDCRSEQVRQGFEAVFARHPREFLLKQARSTGAADLLVVELDEGRPERTFADLRALFENAPQTEVVLTAKRTDPQLLLEAFRIGVKEFLPQPLNDTEVEQALGRIRCRFGARTPSQETLTGNVLCVVGAKGGIGASTLALNLATALQQQAKPGSVVLVDLNLQNNDLPVLLDLATAGGLRDLAQDLSRLDRTILQSVLKVHPTGLHVLGTGFQEPADEPLPSGAALHTVALLRTMFQYVIVDCGSVLSAEVREALDAASKVLVVSVLNVAAIRRAKGLLQQLQLLLQGRAEVAFVVNRYRPKDKQLLKEAEDLLRQKSAWLLSNDFDTVSKALDDGVPLIRSAPRSALTGEYLQRAAALVEEWSPKPGRAGDEPHAKDSVFGKYFSIFAGARAKGQIV